MRQHKSLRTCFMHGATCSSVCSREVYTKMRRIPPLIKMALRNQSCCSCRIAACITLLFKHVKLLTFLTLLSRDTRSVHYRLLPWHLPHVLVASLHHVNIANNVHREALVPVILLCCDAFGAKICNTVDKAVDLAQVSLCDCLHRFNTLFFAGDVYLQEGSFWDFEVRSPTSCFPAALLMSKMATVAPSLARRSTVALPMPAQYMNSNKIAAK